MEGKEPLPANRGAGEDSEETENTKKDPDGGKKSDGNNIFPVHHRPPWYSCLLLGFQHYMAMFVGSLSVPLVMAPALCMGEDNVGKSELIGTLFFVSGIITLLQVIFGVRLAMIQGATFSLLAPTMSFLSLPENECPPLVMPGNNATVNGSLITGSEEHRLVWQSRLRVIQGSIMLAALLEVVLGFSGAIGFLMRFIGPLTISPTVSLLGISLYRSAGDYASKQWLICICTVLLMVIFAQYLGSVSIPCFVYKRRSGCYRSNYPLFRLFPVILALGVIWLLCYILTVSNAFPNDPSHWGYGGRTDLRLDVLREATWFRFPYPGQWGMPEVSVALMCGMFAGLLASTVESVGDYHACARLSGAPLPPSHAINRGILMEGLGTIIAGAFGTGNGTTTTSQNVAVVGITKCGSRIVVIYAAGFMIVFSLLTKFGALFVTVPDPIIGGLFIVLFGMIFSVGIFTLQHADMSTSRNLFVFGTSFFTAFAVSEWLKNTPGAIRTGNATADSVITVLLSTSMFLGGVIAFFLDNTIPGSKEERGLIRFTNSSEGLSVDEIAKMQEEVAQCYDLPFGRTCLYRSRVAQWLPFCPPFGRTTAANRVSAYKKSDGDSVKIDVCDVTQM